MIFLSDSSIAEFQTIYQQETGKKISKEEAAAYGERLIQLVEIVTNIKPTALPEHEPDSAQHLQHPPSAQTPCVTAQGDDRLVSRLVSPSPMTSVGSYAAKTHLSELLERVERGEKILITRRGHPVALLTQPPREPAQDLRSIIEQMKTLQKGNTLGKHLSLRDLIEEGRHS